METTNDLVTFDPVEQVSVQATGMTKPQDSEWKFNMENQMKEMMASLKAIGKKRLTSSLTLSLVVWAVSS
jgi:hypothetical protein